MWMWAGCLGVYLLSWLGWLDRRWLLDVWAETPRMEISTLLNMFGLHAVWPTTTWCCITAALINVLVKTSLMQKSCTDTGHQQSHFIPDFLWCAPYRNPPVRTREVCQLFLHESVCRLERESETQIQDKPPATSQSLFRQVPVDRSSCRETMKWKEITRCVGVFM